MYGYHSSKMYSFATSVVVVFCIVTYLFGDAKVAEDQVYLSYSIPKHAAARGPFYTHNLEQEFFEYRVDGNVVAREFYLDSQITRRQLYLDGNLHGVQLQWYERSAQLMREDPYRNNVRHGYFRLWSEDGLLIGSSSIINGNGTLIEYTAEGLLQLVENYRDNKKHGFRLTFYPNGAIRTLNHFNDGVQTGLSFAFYDTGEVKGYGHYDNSGALHGPIHYFDKYGKLIKQHSSFYLSGRKVDLEEYNKAPARSIHTNELLLENIDNAKGLLVLHEDAMDVYTKFNLVPAIKIPLEEKR